MRKGWKISAWRGSIDAKRVDGVFLHFDEERCVDGRLRFFKAFHLDTCNDTHRFLCHVEADSVAAAAELLDEHFPIPPWMLEELPPTELRAPSTDAGRPPRP